jgi:hypothetical protein
MNAALRKEVRLLLPAWIAALVAATLPAWVMGSDVQLMEQMSFILFAAGALLLSLSSFGLEMSFGTFPSLLAQPRPRLDTWQLKIGLLAVALALVVVAAGFSCWLRVHSILADDARPWYERRDYIDYIRIFWPVHVRGLMLLAVMAFTSGLWTTLLFRQTAVAFWFAILVPLVLYSASWPLIQPLLEEDDTSFVMAALAVVSCGYAAAGYGLARWLFLHAQVKQAQEAMDTATWSFLPAFATPRRPVPVPVPVPVAALLVKELRLQDGTLVIAAVLVLLHLGALAALQYFPALAAKYSFLGGVWMVWWVAPLLVGCASVAEERRGHTLESALCLPVGKLRQFAMKLLVVFGLGILLGAVMPWLLEQLRFGESFSHGLGPDLGLPGLLLTAAIITAVGFYASSLSGTLLQALGVAVGLCVMLPMVLSFFASRPVLVHLSWILLRPFLIATFIYLSYANFKQLRITWRQWRRNGILWLAVVFGTPALLFIVAELIPDWIPYWFHYWTRLL